MSHARRTQLKTTMENFSGFQMFGTKMIHHISKDGCFGSHLVYPNQNLVLKDLLSNGNIRWLTKFRISNSKFKMAANKSRFQMVNTRWLPKQPSYTFGMPFANLHTFCHSKFGQVRVSDPHCILISVSNEESFCHDTMVRSFTF